MSSNSPHTFYNVIHTLIDNNIPLENLICRSLVEPGVANSGFMNNESKVMLVKFPPLDNAMSLIKNRIGNYNFILPLLNFL
jgi:hypothetical protein